MDTIRRKSIGMTPVISSFYNSDANNGKGSWAIGSIIDINDKAGALELKWSDVGKAFDIYQSRSIHVIQHEGFSTKNTEKYGYMLGRHSLLKHGRDKIINFAALFSSLFSH